jgi:preprotein translocase subunit SecG
MTKSTKILIIIMTIILIIFGILLSTYNNVCADDSDSKQIAEYEYQINELRKQKETCFDGLTLQETKDAWN